MGGASARTAGALSKARGADELTRYGEGDRAKEERWDKWRVRRAS